MTNDDGRTMGDERLKAAGSYVRSSFILRPSSFALSRYRCLALLILLALVVGLPTLGHAQDEPPNRAAVIIQHGDGRVVTACVSFGEPEITGLELLSRAGVAVLAQSGGGGSAVCKLDGEGCDYPAEDCFCKCKGAECVYWAYQHLRGGQWSYAQTGAATAKIRPGEVDGWAWGPGTLQAGSQPPALSFEQVCAAPAGEQPTLPAPVIIPPTLPAPELSAPTEAPAAPTSVPPPSPPPVVRPTRTVAPAPSPAAQAAATAIPTMPPTAAPTEPLPTPRPTVLPTEAQATSAPAITSMPPATFVPAAMATPTPAPAGQPGSTTGYLAFGAIVLLLIGGIAVSAVRRRR
jgi:hypothetical protein